MGFMCLCCVQAEVCIRYRGASRMLGDVYKRLVVGSDMIVAGSDMSVVGPDMIVVGLE